MDIEDRTALDEASREAIHELGRRCTEADGTAPFSEQTLLHVDHDSTSTPPETGTGSSADPGSAADGEGHQPRNRAHLLARDGQAVVGYAHLDRPADGRPWAELAVAPSHRRRGTGSALLSALTQADQDLRVWAHGDLPGAVALAERHGFVPVRELVLMSRVEEAGRTTSGPAPQADPTGPGTDGEARTERPLGHGFTVDTFTADDADEWLRVNAAAFASHPEQGRMTRRDLDERMSQPWFDHSGFFLVRDDTVADHPLAAFHWTKLEGGVGEVYVLGVDPAYQGRGLSAPLTRLGLDHLHRRGVNEVRLYVEGDNEAALATYHRTGFRPLSVDVMYAAAKDARPG